MNEVLVGTSHRVASVEYLEAAMRAADDLWDELGTDGAPIGGPSEVVLLRTCNRVEVYATPSNEHMDDWTSFIRERVFTRAAECVKTDVADASYVLRGQAAARHLFRVTAGLDSLVIGEPQIVGQVAQAFSSGLTRETRSPLTELAVSARRASRRVRSETDVGRAPASVSTVAIQLVAERLGSLEGSSVLVIGAGKMGRLSCEEILRHGAAHVAVTSRSHESAHALATRLGVEAVDPAELASRLAKVDVVFTAAGSGGVVLPVRLVREALANRNGRGRLVLVDLAVPRDVEVGVRALPGVTVFDLDDLRVGMKAHPERAPAGLDAAESIVEAEVARYARAPALRRMEPLIGELRQSVEAIRSREVARSVRSGAIDDRTRAEFERFSRALVNKILHGPTAALRGRAEESDREILVALTRELFDLESADGGGAQAGD